MPERITKDEILKMLRDLAANGVNADINKNQAGTYVSTSIMIPSTYPFGRSDTKELEINQAKLNALHTVIARAIKLNGFEAKDFGPATNENPVNAATFAYGATDPQKRSGEEIAAAFKKEVERLQALPETGVNMLVAQVNAVYKELGKQNLTHQKNPNVDVQIVQNVKATGDKYLQ